MTVVMVQIIQTKLCGIHEVLIIEGKYKNFKGALIVPPTSNRIVYNGLRLYATILRHEGQHVDLILNKTTEIM
ncbi:se110 [Alphabaculovirus alterspexiguae]|uniref:Se110 n=1 Tax=Spodoptera exigua multiple nucleopolyhedrovirus TaxID=10454 RepID=A0A3G2JU47_9ABAC|nr:se110 [Spodoptera exigua multiple nucleopolyhedrovirus]AYN45070.1 se110 [Spodoptera exigua multiple nucleopolyhedrovirus]